MRVCVVYVEPIQPTEIERIEAKCTCVFADFFEDRKLTLGTGNGLISSAIFLEKTYTDRWYVVQIR